MQFTHLHYLKDNSNLNIVILSFPSPKIPLLSIQTFFMEIFDHILTNYLWKFVFYFFSNEIISFTEYKAIFLSICRKSANVIPHDSRRLRPFFLFTQIRFRGIGRIHSLIGKCFNQWNIKYVRKFSLCFQIQCFEIF